MCDGFEEYWMQWRAQEDRREKELAKAREDAAKAFAAAMPKPATAQLEDAVPV